MSHLVQTWLIPWAMFAVSLFNVLLCLWLGLTILLNAQSRSWGTWLAGTGFLVGAGFFIIHTAALDYSLDTLLESSPTWWAILAAPVVALPFGWMVLMLWYCGFWETSAHALRRRTGVPFAITCVLAATIVVVGLVGVPQIHASPFSTLESDNFFQYFGARIILWLYPPYLVLCTATALWALSRPAPAGHWSRETSRRRAWPYLFASSVVQLVISLAVGGALLLFGYRSQSQALYNVAGALADWLDATDLALCLGVSLAIMLLGKAVVSFEIFTGKVLPRRGFWQQWRAVVLLAAFYASTLAMALGFEMRLIYPLLLSTTLLGSFLAVFSRRAYAQSERTLSTLAPFVTSGHLLQSLLSGDEKSLRSAVDEPFRALCENVLGAARAVLIPRADVAALFGAPRLFPDHLPMRPGWIELAQTPADDVKSLPVDCGMDYLVPLGDPVPLGALLLGPRRDGSLYTLEEIAVARAVGEHLLDAGAGSTLAARLVALQRQKVAHVATLDRNARRALHDDVLPLLHSALLFPDESNEKIMAAHKEISNLLRETPVNSPLERMSFFAALNSEAESELKGAFDEVEWDIAPEAQSWLNQQPQFLQTTLFFAAREAMRNAARYGRGNEIERELKLQIIATKTDSNEVVIAIKDDGVGQLAVENEDSEKGGSGSGLKLHAALLAVAGGQLSIQSSLGSGSCVELRLPC